MQIKLASVKLAMKYMKRVSAELETVSGGPEEEDLIVQCVRFAFRVHQVELLTILLSRFLVIVCSFNADGKVKSGLFFASSPVVLMVTQ